MSSPLESRGGVPPVNRARYATTRASTIAAMSNAEKWKVHAEVITPATRRSALREIKTIIAGAGTLKALTLSLLLGLEAFLILMLIARKIKVKVKVTINTRIRYVRRESF
jgi:hypothetical protein